MNRSALLVAAALAAGASSACSCSNTCTEEEPDCLLEGLVLEQDGQALSLTSVPAETLARHYPSRTGATAAWAVGEQGTILRFDGAAWTGVESGVAVRLRAVWGPDPAALWAVGEGGVVVRWDSMAWSVAPSGVTADLNAVHGTSATDVWAAGADGTILHWDGAAWSAKPTGAAQPLTGVFAAAPGDAWAVGGAGLVLRWDGASWTRQATPFPTSEAISAVWGTGAADVWAAGRSGWAMRFDGAAWTPVMAPSGAWLQSLSGTGPSDVWAVADAGLALFRFTGAGWDPIPAGALTGFRAVWAAAPNDAFVVGQSVGHWNGRVWEPAAVPAHPGLNGVHGFAPATGAGGGTGGSVIAGWRVGGGAVLPVVGTEAREAFELGFVDPAGCTPAFCFSVCNLRSHCSTAFACTKALRDGRTSGTWRGSLGFTVEPADETVTFDLSVAVLSDPTCAESPAELAPGTVLAGAGPALAVQLERESEADGDGDDGDCAKYTAACGVTQSGIESLGSWYPKTCACPGGMVDQGGSYSNDLCGLSGTGRNCKYCACK